MSNVVCKIGGVDLTQYLKAFSVNPGGDGVVGDGTLMLDKQAGGLNLKSMQDVQIYIPFNTTTNVGVAPRGRLFGGVVKTRDTSPIGTTQLYKLSLWDYNVIPNKSVRGAATVYAVNVSAGTFAAGIAQITSIIQGPLAPKQIDAVSGVANLYATMPATTYEGGHPLMWYYQKYMQLAQSLNTALRPRIYIGYPTTFGVGDVFGNPVVYIYDGALPPAAVAQFSDVPGGVKKPILGVFRRVTDPTAMVQWQQAIFGPNGTIVTGVETASVSTYPNDYIDQGYGTGHQGAWAAEAIKDTQSQTFAQAQALIDQKIRAVGYPRDTFTWETDAITVLPGEYIDLEYSLEGIPAGTLFRVARAAYVLENPNVINVKMTINSRRLGLLEDGTTGIENPPIEGDHVAPLPPASLVKSSEVWVPSIQRVLTTMVVGASPSPDAERYEAEVTENGVVRYENITDITNYVTYVTQRAVIQIRVRCYDSHGNVSQYCATVLSYNSIPALYWETLYNPSFELLDQRVLTDPDGWIDLDSGSGVSQSSTVKVEDGYRSLVLANPAGGGPSARRSDYFRTGGAVGAVGTLDFWALANTAGDRLDMTITTYTFNGTSFTPVQTTSGFVLLTSVFARYSLQLNPGPAGQFATITFTNNTLSSTIYVDNVSLYYQAPAANIITDNSIPTAKYADASILAAKVGVLDYVAATVVTKTANFTADATATTYICNLALPLTATLPDAAKCPGRFYIFKNVNTSKVTVATTASQTIDGITTYPLVDKNGTVMVQSDGANWRVVAQSGLILISDGTRWLGPDTELDFQNFKAPVQPHTVGVEAFSGSIDSLLDFWVSEYAVTYFVATTNNGLNYWKFELKRLNSGAGSVTMATPDTHLAAANTWGRVVATSFSNNPIVKTDLFTQIVTSVIGAPGALQFAVKVKGNYIYA